MKISTIPKSKAIRETLLDNVCRKGIKELCDFLDESGFYIAPASTRYHHAYEGGLIEHSEQVMSKLNFLNERLNLNIPFESVLICGLLHDICKHDSYITKEDGKIVWNNDSIPGHGKKSVNIIEKYIKLTNEEKEAIMYHMGAYEKNEYNWNDLSKSYKKSKLVYFLHVADMMSTYEF